MCVEFCFIGTRLATIPLRSLVIVSHLEAVSEFGWDERQLSEEITADNTHIIAADNWIAARGGYCAYWKLINSSGHCD